MTKHTAKTAEIASELSKTTGEEWTPGEPQGWCEYVSRVRDGLTLCLFWQGSEHWIQLDLSRDVRQTLRYNEHAPRIGCNWPNRSAKSVAGDIVRRLLADAESMFATAMERHAAHMDYESRQRANWERVAELTGVMIPVNMNEYQYVRTPDNDLIKVRCSGSGIGIEATALPADSALAALKALMS